MTAEPQATATDWLSHLPVTVFSMVMGVMGLSLACHGAGFHMAGAAVMWAGVGLFGFLAALYVVKLATRPGAVVAEWNHPAKLAFFPAIPISLVLLAAALRGDAPALASAVWVVGAAGQGVLTVAVISGWIGARSFLIGHITPAWFIPAVGNVIVPIAGAPLGFVEVSWLFLSAGLVLWTVLLALVFNRLIFHDPLPGRLFPTMVILIGPPSVGFLGYVALVEAIDPFARVLLNSAYFFAALVLVQVPHLIRLPFALSFWALSFPVAALSVASFRYAQMTGAGGYHLVGLILLGLLSVIMAGLVLRTVQAAFAGKICVPD